MVIFKNKKTGLLRSVSDVMDIKELMLAEHEYNVLQGAPALLALANTVASKISDAVNRAAFVARAADELRRLSSEERAKKEKEAVEWYLYAATNARPTPLGPLELWSFVNPPKS